MKTTKILIQTYFIFFIILNILDFLNYLSGDIDFFKKLLSWSIIGYIFYKASFSKIFTGNINRKIDIAYIIGFSLMGIIKSLIQYTIVNPITSETFPIFYIFLQFIPENPTLLLDTSFIIGLIIIIITSIILINLKKPTINSLIGSFKLKGYVKFIGGNYILLTLISIFFGLIVFNFIMEWFALAVDSIILVLGLIYYIIKYLHHHTNIKTDKYMNKIANTGNSFYQNLITQFSNKKTFMIGVSFILTLHLLVDVGVYLIPFSTGLENPLYGTTINSIPIFNLKDPSNSQIAMDLTQIIGNKIIPSIIILTINLSTLLLFAILMITPFYYFYQNIEKKKIKLPNSLEFLLIASLLITLLTFALPTLNSPISITIPEPNTQIYGVELITNNIINLQPTIPNIKVTLDFVLFLIITIIILMETNLILKSNFNKLIKSKIIPTIILTFFISYISIFFFTTIRNEVNQIFFDDKISQDNFDEYQKTIRVYNQAINNPLTKRTFSHVPIQSQYFNLEITPFSDLNPKLISTNQKHNDYLLIKISNITQKEKFVIKNHKKNALFENSYTNVNKYFKQKEFTFIYKLGENNIEFSSFSSGDLKIEKINSNWKNIIQTDTKSQIKTIIEYLRLIVTSIFYIFGILAFTKHFVKTNLLKS